MAQVHGPRRDEVLVKVVATGLCHTDLVARDKAYPVPQPIVLGHEGAGIVESVGADVVRAHWISESASNEVNMIWLAIDDGS